MDSDVHEIAKRSIDHPLPLDTVLAPERRAFDPQREVALAGRIVAAVAAMLLAIVNKVEARWRKRRVQPCQHFGRDRTSFLGVHALYIKEPNANETIQNARAGRRSQGEVRRAG